MADKEEDKNEDEGKKKGLSPVILVAVGAILGGAGVVFGMPAGAPTDQNKVEEAPKVLEVAVAKNPMTFSFNPRSDTGKHFARAKIRFSFKVEEPDLADAQVMLKEHWTLAESEVRKLLRNTHYTEWQTEEGLLLIEQEIRNELTYRLFRGPTKATTNGLPKSPHIYWDEIVTQ